MGPTATNPTSTKTSQHDINILLNRTSVALARSQRLVDSWLPPTTFNEATPSSSLMDANTSTTNNDPSNGLASLLAEVGRSERAGLGFVDPDASSTGINGSRSIGGESELEKLRRQMLGKRGAKIQAQGQAAARGSKGGATLGAGGQVGRTEVAGGKGEVVRGQPKRKEVDSEDEDEGRSGAFKSKRVKKVKTVAAPSQSEVHNAKDKDSSPADVPGLNTTNTAAEKKDEDAAQPTEAASKVLASTATAEQHYDSDSKTNPTKKPTSFLDEILLKRDKKKKKKRRNKSTHSATAGDAAEAAASG